MRILFYRGLALHYITLHGENDWLPQQNVQSIPPQHTRIVVMTITFVTVTTVNVMVTILTIVTIEIVTTTIPVCWRCIDITFCWKQQSHFLRADTTNDHVRFDALRPTKSAFGFGQASCR